ncbi:MAG TPA: NADPH:quinone oxidoreductase family protein [Acidimicrobiia bacterium]|nr:NADPH:quinone oxidoreductase family protein [Acidimicrobiia bacterium]
MRAAYVPEHGPPEVVVVEELPDPAPGPGEVVVDIAHAAVNFPDVLIVNNEYQVQVPAPFVPGSEFSGVISAVGDGVEGVRVGDHVYGASFVGAYAEKIVVHATSVHVIPDSVDLRDAAAFSVAHTTAMHTLRTIADLQPGETVLVLGAAGGVGLASVELATLMGGQVIAAASSPEKLALCAKYGAVAGIDYTKEDLKTRVKELTGGGAGVVVDPVGGPYSEQALRATKWGSRFVVVGFASGEIPRIPLNLILLKGVIVRGMEMRSIAEAVPDLVARDQRELQELFVGGKIHPHVSAVYPLADTAVALRSMLERTATGKVLIDVTA